MEEIEYNIKLRKLYSSKLCEFYNYIKEKIDKETQFNFNVIELINEEKELSEKFQSKNNKINSFEKEIFNLLANNNVFNDSKRREIEYLQSSFKKQIQDARNHYIVFLNNLEKTRNSWLNEIMYKYISYSDKQRYLIELSIQIQEAYPNFKFLCDSWNIESIKKAEETLLYISEIEIFCQKILQEFDKASILSNKIISTVSQNKISLAQQCEKLSELLEIFFKDFNIIELLNKLKTEDVTLFKNEFSEIFGSNGFGKIRSNIKLVYDTEATNKRVHIIYQTFKKLQLIINPEMKKLKDKKYKLLTLCFNSSEINRLSTEKWVIKSYSDIFKPLDLIIENRNY